MLEIVTGSLYIIYLPLQSPFKWFLKNNEKTLSPKKVAQFRRMSVLVSIFYFIISCHCLSSEKVNDPQGKSPCGLEIGFPAISSL